MPNPSEQPVNTRRIWGDGAHCAFTDLVFFDGRWLCCFRESDSHALGILGIIRVIESQDGEDWHSVHVFSDSGFDLRDPHFSRPSDDRLMINFTGRTQVDGRYEDVLSFASFLSADNAWDAPVAMESDGYWIWQIRWHEGVAYTWARKIIEGLPYRFLRSKDGIHWEKLVQLDGGNETSITFLADGRLLAFRRRADAEIGISSFPYLDWQWHSQQQFVGGPNLLVLSSGEVIAGCRLHRPGVPQEERSYFVINVVDVEKLTFQPVMEFAGGQDCGYPGLVENGGEIWVSHYAGSKTQSAIYLSRVPISAFKRSSGT